MVDYNPQIDPWYSPIKVINEFEKLRSRYGDARLKDAVFKRAREMFVGSVALLGAYELSPENKYWLQSNTQSETPDVIASTQKEGGEHGITLLLNQMEITEMEEHANTSDVVEFLRMTKFSRFKSYTKNDMIILLVNKVLLLDPPTIHKKLHEFAPNSSVHILGRTTQAQPGDFIIVSTYPILSKTVAFNIDETAKKYWLPEKIEFHLSSDKKIVYKKAENKPVNTYDILGLNRDEIYKKFKIPPGLF